jgi:hypothetical protein
MEADMHLMKSLGVTVLALILTDGIAGAAPVQWSGNGHYYEAIYVPAGISWRAAYDSCQAHSGYLATLTSSAEHAFVYGLVSGRAELWYIDGSGNGIGPWLGGFQPPGSGEPGGGWRWVSDEPWVYTAWSPGEPNNTGGAEDRLGFFKLGGLMGDRWNDMPGTYLIKGYVIEIPTSATECTTANGHTYRLVRTPGRISWSDASAEAAAMGGHLATITSSAENQIVASLATPDPTLWCIDPAGNGQGPWIGGYQPAGSPEPAGGWTWVTGEAFTFSTWAISEPNNLNGVEHYIQLFGKGSLTGSQWNDMGDFTIYGGLGFIVEFDDERGCLASGVGDAVAPPFRIKAPYPNPARRGASVAFEMPIAGMVSAEVFDLSGRHLRSLAESTHYEAGHHVVSWDGLDQDGSLVASGVYLVRLTVSDRALSRRVVILR